MRRREFLSVLGGAATWSLAMRAQPERMRRIGVLMARPETNLQGRTFNAAFREGLQKLGWTEGRDIRIDSRWAAGDTESRQ